MYEAIGSLVTKLDALVKIIDKVTEVKSSFSVRWKDTQAMSRPSTSRQTASALSRALTTKINVWYAESGKLALGPLEGHTGAVMSVNFSPDGKCIVSGSDDRTIRLWDTERGELILPPLEGHMGVVTSANFSPDGKRIVSGSTDKIIRIWDVLTQDTSTLSGENSINASGVGLNQNIYWTLTVDGWVIDEHDNLLLWVPHDIHNTLWRPRNTAIFSCAFSTKLDFTIAALSTYWTDRFRPFI